ncbi:MULTISPECIES: DUF6428 family protein [Rhizobium]|uniref:DUF6428 family protein n=1 Tax=Rhizobium TaxID=379 RepID=UPI00140A843C|nr:MULTISPECIES: DUF6428 family protein [Rhizobium]MDG3576834.1 DUF6428 family protein [Rhizobium sp. YJ-22]
MNMIDKAVSADTDITLGDLLDRMAETPELPLVFSYDGRQIKPGYHVTEVKAGKFSALDCGANPEAWSEIFVQLWDVEEGERTHMTAGKFSAIVRKVSEHVKLDASAKLTFEVSDGVRPMQLFCADQPVTGNGALAINLMPRPASCKPRDRWLAQKLDDNADCCSDLASARCCT